MSKFYAMCEYIAAATAAGVVSDDLVNDACNLFADSFAEYMQLWAMYEDLNK